MEDLMNVPGKAERINNRIVWVEALYIPDFIALFIETVFFGSLVRYDEKTISAAAARLLAILRRLGGCKNFQPAKLTMDKKNAAGFAFTYSKEKDFALCLERFSARFLPNATARFKSTVNLYIYLFLNRKVTFISMVESSSDFKQSGRTNVFYITGHPLNSLIKSYYEEKGYFIKESRLFYNFLKYFFMPYYRLCAFVIKKYIPKSISTNIGEPKAAIWIEYYHNSLGLPFYADRLERDKFDIVCYLDRNDGFPLSDEIAAIEGMGLKWIDLRSDALAKLSDISMIKLWRMFCSLLRADSGYPGWFRVFQFEYRMQYLLYKAVFKHFKVKMLFQHQDWSWMQEAQAKALEDAGGVMLGYHWSNCLFYRQAGYFTPQHAYFVWGKVMYEYLRKRGDIIRHILPAGIWFGPADDGNAKVFLKENLKFTMAIFDSGVAYDIHQSEQALGEFYLRIFRMLTENPSWGGIIKSRGWSRIHDLEFLPRGKEIVALGAVLIEQERLIFLNNKISPVIAAKNADICVCYGLNSAGIVSGIYGHRVIHCDSSGWLHYPLYKDLDQKVIFRDIDETVQALIMVSSGDTRIGDFSKWKGIYNHFDDFNGRSRISDFIGFFMDDVVKRGDPIKSLDLAADQYKKAHSIEEAFFQEEGLWEDESGGQCGFKQ